jgi:nucleotide-binding universal stress UspA family protein
MTGQKRIVVGIDGSAPSKAALRWALRQAKFTGASVDAVIAWHNPTALGVPGMPPFAQGAIGIEDDARKILTETLNEVAGLDPDVQVHPEVGQGRAAEVLVHAAKGADMLVVGSRGHGAFTSTMVGSVSLNCVLHAHCPVMVLHAHDEEAA